MSTQENTSPTAAEPSAKMRLSTAVPNSADSPHWTATLNDGTHVVIRPIHKTDGDLERAFFQRLSPEARHMRFLGQMTELSDDLLNSLIDIDYRRDVAFIALVHRDNEKQEIGVARYGTNEDGTICECAVTVADDWQKKGLGSVLMHHLIDVARDRGVQSMISLDAADNLPMRDLAHFLGFLRETDPNDATQVIHTLTL
ncbi:MAG: GNAT family N-acetyltransferase [Dokdonella sp.]